MAYNKRTWATGNVVGAVDLNRIENGIADIDVDEIRGWDVQNTQLFSETVTTTDDGGMNVGTLVYSDTINADSIVVTFNGTDYTCSRIDVSNAYFYGRYSQSGPDFSEYPFAIQSSDGRNYLVTQTAGTYTVAVGEREAVASDDFSEAVNMAVEPNLSTLPLLCVSGETTYSEIDSAYDTAFNVFHG